MSYLTLAFSTVSLPLEGITTPVTAGSRNKLVG
jgi:hypothetical protein